MAQGSTVLAMGCRFRGIGRLPMELWENIIDIIAAIAHADLRDCWLVCKAWQPRCQFYLFKSMKVQCEEDAEALAALATVCSHFQVVERLTIYGIASDDGSCRGPTPHLFIVAKKLLPALPHLNDLILRDVEWAVKRSCHVDEYIFRYIRTSSSIKRLHLDNVVMNSNLVFAHFVDSLLYCNHVTFLNTRVGPHGTLFKEVAFDTMSLREILEELSERRGVNPRQVHHNLLRLSRGPGKDGEERLGNTIQGTATTGPSFSRSGLPLASEGYLMSTYDPVMPKRLPRSLLEHIDSKECEDLIKTLKRMDIQLADAGSATHSHQDVLATVRAAMTSKQSIQVIKNFAEAGYHRTVVNLLDAVLGSIAPQFRLYTTVFHTLRKMCVKYGDVPESLVLPHHSIVLINERLRPQEIGGFADIYLGRWSEMKRVVGVKAFRVSCRDAIETTMKKIAKEATLWRRLVHPNITPFYGIDREHFDISMVCKWMPNGHIIKFLGNAPNANRPQLILDAARGLEYLHSEHIGIVHGDLKGGNILVDERCRACLSDFGLSTLMYDCHTVNTVTQISTFSSSLRWMAPEIYDPESYDLKSALPSCEADIYSFSMVVWEVFTEQVPFSEARNEGSLTRKIMGGERPQRPDDATCLGLSDRVWAMTERGWSAEPSARPSITEMITGLEEEWSLDSPSRIMMDIDTDSAMGSTSAPVTRRAHLYAEVPSAGPSRMRTF